MPDRFGVLSHDLWRWRRELTTIVEAEPVRIGMRPPSVDGVLGWAGRRGALARRWARLMGVPFREVSFGPVHSVRPERDPPASLRVAHNDARGGDAQEVDNQEVDTQEVDADRAASGLAVLRRLRLAWRNDGRDRLPDELAASADPVVIVAVEAPGRAWPRSRLDRASVASLIARAEAACPSCRIALIAASGSDPSVVRGAAGRRGVVPVLGINPWALLDRAVRIQAAPGDLATLARLSNRPLQWSEGQEAETPDPARLFGAAFLAGTTWFDAWSRRPVDFETAADQVAWLRARHLDNDRRAVCVGISGWKAATVARFLDGPDGAPIRTANPEAAIREAVRHRGRIVAWETRMPARLPVLCEASGVPLVRMEDGFLRSVGLGAAFLPGRSVILDDVGIYYDPAGPSRLEGILQTAEIGPDLVVRAAALRERIVALRLSKYNVGRPLDGPDDASGRPHVLVPGQVEDDASVLLGARGPVRTNLDLLREARRRNPEALITWKPHPDVAAGLRAGHVDPQEAFRFADRIVSDVSIADLIDRTDTVETMTSLAGFEALMRGRHVVAHGQPFYAGWGLTEDLHPIGRRTRARSLDELVAAALILYPAYLDPETGLPCPPEILIERLAAARLAAEREPSSRVAARLSVARWRHAVLDPIVGLTRRMRGVARPAARRSSDGPGS